LHLPDEYWGMGACGMGDGQLAVIILLKGECSEKAFQQQTAPPCRSGGKTVG
jgi:hypothetical protein